MNPLHLSWTFRAAVLAAFLAAGSIPSLAQPGGLSAQPYAELLGFGRHPHMPPITNWRSFSPFRRVVRTDWIR